jgi:hypothetical protein
VNSIPGNTTRRARSAPSSERSIRNRQARPAAGYPRQIAAPVVNATSAQDLLQDSSGIALRQLKAF